MLGFRHRWWSGERFASPGKFDFFHRAENPCGLQHGATFGFRGIEPVAEIAVVA